MHFINKPISQVILQLNNAVLNTLPHHVLSTGTCNTQTEVLGRVQKPGCADALSEWGKKFSLSGELTCVDAG